MKHLRLIRRILIALILAASLVLVYAWVKTGDQDIADVHPRLHPVTDAPFAKSFTLTSHNRETITEKSWPDKYKLVYFGFTYCPAICPTELAKVTAALNTLGDKNAIIQPLFITVDPERDTAAKMKEYVGLFHPSLVGLTGTAEQVDAALKAFKIYAAKVKDDTMTEYTMDHSSFIYLIAPDGRLLHIFKMEDTAADIANMTGRWLEQEKLR